MSNSYKPKLIELFFQQQAEGPPQLIELNTQPLTSQNKEARKQKRTGDNKVVKTKRDPNKENKLDLSSYRYESISVRKENLSIDIEQEYIEPNKKLLSSIQILEQQTKATYQKRISSLEQMVIEEKKKVKEISSANQKLVKEKSRLDKQIKSIKVVESYVSTKRTTRINTKPEETYPDNTKVLEKLQSKLKVSISEFLENIKMEQISSTLESKIEEFLTQLIQMCPLNNEIKPENSKKRNKSDIKVSNTAHSRNESPIACQSFMNPKLKTEYSPYLQLSNNPNLSIQYPQQLIGCQNDRQKEGTFKQNQKMNSNIARFSFVQDSVFPSMNEQSAFISISHIDRSLDKSYQEKHQSKSQRRRKIFQ